MGNRTEMGVGGGSYMGSPRNRGHTEVGGSFLTEMGALVVGRGGPPSPFVHRNGGPIPISTQVLGGGRVEGGSEMGGGILHPHFLTEMGVLGGVEDSIPISS